MNSDYKNIFIFPRNKILFTGMILALIFFILFGYLTFRYVHLTEEQRLQQMKQMVQLARNTIEPIVQKYRLNNITAETAVVEVRNIVRRMTFNDPNGANYIFMSSYDGIMLVQPFEPEKEMTDQWNLRDDNGIFIIRELVRAAQSCRGEGYVTYFYLHPVVKRTEEKVSYVIGIPELGCYIGTGRYMNDIRDAEFYFLFKTIVLTVIILCCLVFFIRISLKEIRSRNISLMNEIAERKRMEEIIHMKNQELTSANEEYEAQNEELIASQSEIIEINKELKKKQGELTFLISNIPGMVYRYEIYPDLKMLYLSDGSTVITGYPPQVFVENGKLIMDILHPDDREKLTDDLKSSTDENGNFQVKYRIQKKGEQLRWVLQKGRAVSVDGKKILEGIITDITDFEIVEQQLRQAQKMETVGTLAGGVAHDFNNIIGGIMGSINIMERLLKKQNIDVSGDFDKYIRIIQNSSIRAAEIVRQLLTFSRQHDMQMISIDLNKSVENILNICKYTFPKEVSLKCSECNVPAQIIADAAMVEQALLNLCINSSHAMTVMRSEEVKHGGVIDVGIKRIVTDSYFCRQHSDAVPGTVYWRVEVSDSGVGMNQEVIERIFDPFFSTKSASEGAGLGLSMVYNTMKKHDGFITVYSLPGEGTTFHLYFPEKKSERVQDAETNIKEIPVSGSGLILVIDDEEDLRTVAEGILEDSGYNVVTCGSGLEGLLFYEDNMASVVAVLLDLSMPGMSGKETFIELKKIDPEIKVLLASGYIKENDIRDIMELGVMDYIQKPYTLSELTQKISQVIGRDKEV